MSIDEEMYEESLDREIYNYLIDEDVCNFKETLNNAALKLVCRVCANTNSFRSEVYTTISKFQKMYFPQIISGTCYKNVYFM